ESLKLFIYLQSQTAQSAPPFDNNLEHSPIINLIRRLYIYVIALDVALFATDIILLTIILIINLNIF
ncbi:MAG: hypothetical protein ACI828_000723, partial [Flavobacteriales bacterium]